MEKDEPYNDFLEEVKIGTECIHRHADVIVSFDSRTGDFNEELGYIVDRTPSRITKGEKTTLTVRSNGGHRYVVIRKPGGDYEAQSWFTWVTFTRTYLK